MLENRITAIITILATIDNSGYGKVASNRITKNNDLYKKLLKNVAKILRLPRTSGRNHWNQKWQKEQQYWKDNSKKDKNNNYNNCN